MWTECTLKYTFQYNFFANGIFLIKSSRNQTLRQCAKSYPDRIFIFGLIFYLFSCQVVFFETPHINQLKSAWCYRDSYWLLKVISAGCSLIPIKLHACLNTKKYFLDRKLFFWKKSNILKFSIFFENFKIFENFEISKFSSKYQWWNLIFSSKISSFGYWKHHGRVHLIYSFI